MDHLPTHLEVMGGGVVIDLDHSFFIQLAIVLLLMALLRGMVFEPYLKTLDARSARTIRAREEADALRARAQELEARYAAGLGGARDESADLRLTTRSEVVATRDSLITSARAKSEQTVTEAQVAIASATEKARLGVEAQVDALSARVAEKVLGRSL